jgi:serine/threonine protein kinase
MAAPAREAGSPAEFAPDPAGVAGVQRLCQLSTLLQVVAREDEDDAGPPRDAAGLVIPESICKAILVELLEALVPVHAHRKRHRYVRPWTVAITAAGRVELGGGKGFEDSRLSANSSAESMQSFVDGAHDRWYWTPERLMGSEKDGAEVDIWAVGAIFSEMLLGSPIFYGFDPANQLFTMFKTLGFPSRAQLSYLGNGYDQLVLPAKTMPATLRDKLPCLGDDAHDLLVRLLDWCPNSRISASAALQHPYLAPRAMPQREARASIVQFLINKASDLSGISQEISRFSDDADHHDDDHHHDAAAAGAGFSRGRHDNMHSSGNLRSSDRQAHPETEELSAACNVYSKLDAPLSLDLPLSSSGAGQGRTCPKPSRKPLAVLALSKGTVVPDSPQEGQGSAWTPKSYGGAERGDAACGAVRSTAAPQALYLSQRRSSDVVETARGHGTPLCHGALCGDENCGGNAQKEAEEQLLSPAVIRKSGFN